VSSESEYSAGSGDVRTRVSIVFGFELAKASISAFVVYRDLVVNMPPRVLLRLAMSSKSEMGDRVNPDALGGTP
jgi:hypothetical protein